MDDFLIYFFGSIVGVHFEVSMYPPGTLSLSSVHSQTFTV